MSSINFKKTTASFIVILLSNFTFAAETIPKEKIVFSEFLDVKECVLHEESTVTQKDRDYFVGSTARYTVSKRIKKEVWMEDEKGRMIEGTFKLISHVVAEVPTFEESAFAYARLNGVATNDYLGRIYEFSAKPKKADNDWILRVVGEVKKITKDSALNKCKMNQIVDKLKLDSQREVKKNNVSVYDSDRSINADKDSKVPPMKKPKTQASKQ